MAGAEGPLADDLEVATLADVDRHRHHLEAELLLEPGDRHRCVEAPAVGEHHALGHYRAPFSVWITVGLITVGLVTVGVPVTIRSSCRRLRPGGWPPPSHRGPRPPPRAPYRHRRPCRPHLRSHSGRGPSPPRGPNREGCGGRRGWPSGPPPPPTHRGRDGDGPPGPPDGRGA